MKILTIIGARPQFIKASVVSKAIANSSSKEIILHTGQHYDKEMSDVFFEELNIPHPKYNLGIGGGTHGKNTGRMIESIEDVLLTEKPDWLMVYGDTDSTLAGAIAAAKLNIPIAHVEAGLRSFNKKMPEEINRILTDHCSSALFTPTQGASTQLENEGIDKDRIILTGDVMYDATVTFTSIANKFSRILEKYNLKSTKYILATIHRQENTDNAFRLNEIFSALSAVSLPVILPLHPRTRKKINEFNIQIGSNITITPSIGYFDMLNLEKNASVIATDSGGVQKEAFFHGVPCVTFRDETEWNELITIGANKLALCDSEIIKNTINDSIGNTIKESKIYGDGNSSKKISAFFEKNENTTF